MPRKTDGVRLADDRHGLVTDNVRLAVRLGSRVANGRLRGDDLEGPCVLALVEAAARWDESMCTKFSTYLWFWVRRKVVDAVYGDAALHIPASTVAYVARGKGAEVPRPARDREARREAARKAWRAESLDSPDPETGWARAGLILDHRVAPEPRDALVGERVRHRLSHLTPRERTVLELLFGVGRDRPENQAAVGRQLGISRERVRQLRITGLAKLRLMYTDREDPREEVA